MSSENSGYSDRKIIHIDMDAFYASVEQRDRPELQGRPVVVGGDPHGRGVVAAASYEARKFGVRSAISSAKALRLCPQAVFVRPDIRKYSAVSDQIHEIFREVTEKIEPLSLDEAYLDVTENKLGEPLASKVAAHLKRRIRETTQLTASAGVAPNKFVAKLASDFRKPDGLVVVPPQHVLRFVDQLPVERLWGLGPVTAARLHELGIRTAADIRRRSPEELEQEFGKFGYHLYELSHGEDQRQVETEWEPKSRGTETTFDRDILDVQELMDVLDSQAEELADDLKRIDRRGRTVTVKLRYADFKTVTRSESLLRSTSDATVIAQTARELLFRNTQAGEVPIRLLGVSMSGFTDPVGPEQLWLDLPIW